MCRRAGSGGPRVGSSRTWVILSTAPTDWHKTGIIMDRLWSSSSSSPLHSPGEGNIHFIVMRFEGPFTVWRDFTCYQPYQRARGKRLTPAQVDVIYGPQNDA